MDKIEQPFKQSFDIDFGEIQPQNQPSKKSKIIKISALIVTGVAIITTVALLVAHFKFGLFDKEVYDLASVKREVYSADFFNEEKTIKTRMGYVNGENFEKEQLINTNFLVLLTDKKEEKIGTFINTAFLVVLDSKTKVDGVETELGSLNIFDEKSVKDFESNPDGFKHPFAYFKFYENGTLIDINLPKQTDPLNARNIIDLINNVIPKLSRNKTEDDKDGLEIKTRTNRKKKTFSEYTPPKEYMEKYTKAKFKGSKITKLVETDVEDEKITEIRANTNVYLETQKNEDNTNHFGLENFKFDISSKIVATKNEKEKTVVAKLLEKLASKIEFINSDKLMKLYYEKVDEEKNTEEAIVEQQKRNLAGVDAKLYWEWVLLNKDILGTSVSASYVIDFSSTKITNKIVIKAGRVTLTFGNKDGLSKKEGQNKEDSGSSTGKDFTLCSVPLYAGLIHLDVKLSFSLSYGIKFETNYDVTVKLNGKVDLKAEINAGGWFVKLTMGVKGNMIDANFSTKFGKSSGLYSKKNFSLTIGAGNITGYLNGEVGGQKLVNVQLEIWKGFTPKQIF